MSMKKILATLTIFIFSFSVVGCFHRNRVFAFDADDTAKIKINDYTVTDSETIKEIAEMFANCEGDKTNHFTSEEKFEYSVECYDFEGHIVNMFVLSSTGDLQKVGKNSTEFDPFGTNYYYTGSVDSTHIDRLIEIINDLSQEDVTYQTLTVVYQGQSYSKEFPTGQWVSQPTFKNIVYGEGNVDKSVSWLGIFLNEDCFHDRISDSFKLEDNTTVYIYDVPKVEGEICLVYTRYKDGTLTRKLVWKETGSLVTRDDVPEYSGFGKVYFSNLEGNIIGNEEIFESMIIIVIAY